MSGIDKGTVELPTTRTAPILMILPLPKSRYRGTGITRAMAQAMGISKASVSRIWRANGLKPHRIDSCKVSNDPQFADKLEAIVGLYLNPPEHALVLSVEEKRQIQALERARSLACL